MASLAERARVLEALGRNPALASVAPEDLVALAGLASVRSLRPGERAGSEGAGAQAVCLVLGGCLRISSVSGEGREFVYEMLGPGAFHGLGNVLRASVQEAQAHAAGRASVATIEAKGLRRMLGERPHLWPSIMAILQGRVVTALSLLRGQGASLRQRIAHRLLAQALSCGKALAGGRPVLRLSQADLAQMLGASRSRVNKALADLEGMGLLRAGYRTIELLQPDGLRRLAQEEAGAAEVRRAA